MCLRAVGVAHCGWRYSLYNIDKIVNQIATVQVAINGSVSANTEIHGVIGQLGESMMAIATEVEQQNASIQEITRSA